MSSITHYFGPLPMIAAITSLHVIAGKNYANIYHLNPDRCKWIFGITSLARTAFRILGGFLMHAYLDSPQSFVRAKILLDSATYSISILAFRYFGLIDNRGALALSGLAACLNLVKNIHYCPYLSYSAEWYAKELKFRIQHGFIGDLISLV